MGENTPRCCAGHQSGEGWISDPRGFETRAHIAQDFALHTDLCEGLVSWDVCFGCQERGYAHRLKTKTLKLLNGLNGSVVKKRIVLRTSDMHKRMGFTSTFVSTGVLERCLEAGYEVWVLSSRKSFDEKDAFWRAVVPPERVFHARPNDWITGSSHDHMRLLGRLMKALGIELPDWVENPIGEYGPGYEECCDHIRAHGIPVGFTEDVDFISGPSLEEALESLPFVEVGNVYNCGGVTHVYARLTFRLSTNRRDRLTNTLKQSVPRGTVIRRVRNADIRC